MRNGDEGWETYRFNDVTTENRTQSNGMRNLGVELTSALSAARLASSSTR